MKSTMLRTGEAARMLGVSRQHVVDLCNSNRLPSSLVGTHRRIPRSAVESMLSVPLPEEKLKSLWLHRAVLGKLVADPVAILDKARRNVAASRERLPRSTVYFDGWDRVLDAGVEEVARVLVATDEWSTELRANTPFTDVLTEDERQAVLGSFRRSRGR